MATAEIRYPQFRKIHPKLNFIPYIKMNTKWIGAITQMERRILY